MKEKPSNDQFQVQMNNNHEISSDLQREVVNTPKVSPKICKMKYNKNEPLSRRISPLQCVRCCNIAQILIFTKTKF
jgi:hypothetical protein